MQTLKVTTQLSSLLSLEENLNFYQPISKIVGAGEKRELIVDRGPMTTLENLYPDRPIQLHNDYEYPAYRTPDNRGKPFTLYLRRALADLMMRERGILMPKGFVVKLRDYDNPYDLRWSNLKITEAAPLRARNSFMVHYLNGQRVSALLGHVCPDEHMATIIAKNTGGVNRD